MVTPLAPARMRLSMKFRSVLGPSSLERRETLVAELQLEHGEGRGLRLSGLAGKGFPMFLD